jgi:hypothetical protein
MLWTERPSAQTLPVARPRRQPTQPTLHVSKKKLLMHLFLSTRFSSYRSYPLACGLRAHGRWPFEAQRAATSKAHCLSASEAHCSPAGLARNGARPPPSGGARLSILPGAARCCPRQVAQPRPPHRSCDQCLPSSTCRHCRRAAASSERYTPTSLHSVEQQGLKAHVASMFQLF